MPQPKKNICWSWPRTHRKVDGRPTVAGDYVYRLVYEAATGEPLTKSMHHTCGNAWCINPWHVEPLDQTAHARKHGLGGDWGQADKETCANGHPYDDENTYTYTRKDGRVERHCRECTREAKRRFRAARRS